MKKLVKMLKMFEGDCVMFKKFEVMFKKILGFEVMIEVMMQLIWLAFKAAAVCFQLKVSVMCVMFGLKMLDVMFGSNLVVMFGFGLKMFGLKMVVKMLMFGLKLVMNGSAAAALALG